MKTKNVKFKLAAIVCIFLMSFAPLFVKADAYAVPSSLTFTNSEGGQEVILNTSYGYQNPTITISDNSWIEVLLGTYQYQQLPAFVIVTPYSGTYPRVGNVKFEFIDGSIVNVSIIQNGSVPLGVLKPGCANGISTKVTRWQSPVPSLIS